MIEHEIVYLVRRDREDDEIRLRTLEKGETVTDEAMIMPYAIGVREISVLEAHAVHHR
jgi:hypothetical protein